MDRLLKRSDYTEYYLQGCDNVLWQKLSGISEELSAFISGRALLSACFAYSSTLKMKAVRSSIFFYLFGL
jgi:hypothetical protein